DLIMISPRFGGAYLWQNRVIFSSDKDML
ncbi:phosphatase, partial [Salmonella enterica]|nr:phosphatase [Salmonella enterica]